jgi:hypothetical protein
MKLTKELVEGMGFKHHEASDRYIRMDGTELSEERHGDDWIYLDRHHHQHLVKTVLEVTNHLIQDGTTFGIESEFTRIRNGFKDLFKL